jgi:hypothetical protein
LTKSVLQLRRVRDQLVSRNKLLDGNQQAAQLVQESTKLIEKLNELESRMHNPNAEVSYDILAFQGGAKMYSQLSMLYDQVMDADAIPTQGMRERYAELKPEHDRLEAELKALLSELSALNTTARTLDLPIILP